MTTDLNQGLVTGLQWANPTWCVNQARPCCGQPVQSKWPSILLWRILVVHVCAPANLDPVTLKDRSNRCVCVVNIFWWAYFTPSNNCPPVIFMRWSKHILMSYPEDQCCGSSQKKMSSEKQTGHQWKHLMMGIAHDLFPACIAQHVFSIW
jgi:hypothetical protein